MCGFCSTGRQELLSVRLQVEVQAQLEVEVSSSAGKARFFFRKLGHRATFAFKTRDDYKMNVHLE